MHFGPYNFVQLMQPCLASNFPRRALVHLHLVASLLIGIVGDEKVCVGCFVRRLDAAREIHRIANDCASLVRAPAYAAHDNGTVVQADPDAEAPAMNRLEVRLHALHGLQHFKPRVNGARHRLLGILQSENRENPVSHIIVDDSTVAVNDSSNLVVVPVERMNDVIRKQSLGEGGESPDVRKEDRRMPFLANRLSERIVHAFGSEVLIFIIKYQPPGRYGSHYPRLTGKPDYWFERKVLGDNLFLIGARRAVLKTFENRDATCGTTGIAAAGVRQANSRTQSRLKNRFA